MSQSFLNLRTFAFVVIALVFGALHQTLIAAQQPLPPPPPAAEPAGQSQPVAQDNSKKQQYKIAPFLILGTVFTEKDFAFPGVEVRIRRKGEKKFRFETYTNSRGEFAIRVPDGIEYEVVVKQAKYKEQSQEVVANMQEVQKRLTFKLEPVVPAKPGDSK